MTTRHEIEQTRERMLDAVAARALDLYDLRHGDRKRREAEHEERWWSIKVAEIAAGLRDWTYRRPFAVGERVLLRYPAREGVVIDESRFGHGSRTGAETLARTADGGEIRAVNEFFVSLDFREDDGMTVYERMDPERQRALDILRSLRPDEWNFEEPANETAFRVGFRHACAKAAAIIEKGAESYGPTIITGNAVASITE